MIRAVIATAVLVLLLVFHENIFALFSGTSAPPHTDAAAGDVQRTQLHARLAELRSAGTRAPRKAMDEVRSVIRAADSLGYPFLRAESEQVLAMLYRENGSQDTAAIYAQRSLEGAIESGDSDRVAESYILRGTIRFERGALDSAMADYEEAMRYIDPARDSTLLLQVHSNRANVLSRRGDFARSTARYLDAIRLSEAMGREEELAVLYDNLASDNSRWGNHERAIEYHHKAIAINEAHENRAGLASTYANLGVAYKEKGDPGRALAAYKHSLQLARVLGNNAQIAQNLHNMGVLYRQQEQLEQAVSALDSSLLICERDGLRYGVMLNHGSLGNLHAQRGAYELAETHFNIALALAEEMQLPEEEAEFYDDMGDLYERKGDYRRALAMEQQYHVLRDSLFSRSARDDFQELQVKYEAEKKEFENRQLRAQNEIHQLEIEQRNIIIIAVSAAAVLAGALLVFLFISRKRKVDMLRLVEQKNHIIEQKSRQLAESNALKELLLDIVTHDLANPATTIAGSVSLLKGELPDNEFTDILQKSSRRLNSVLENVRALTAVTLNDEIPRENLRLRPLVEDAVAEYANVLRETGMETEIDIPADFTVAANPVIGEVFKNFISNAIRYAGSGQRIVIDARHENGGALIRVSDFGETIPETERQVIFRRSVQLSTGQKRGHGVGLAIVARIVSAHDGDVWVEANTPRGNRFCVRLPHPS